jgi:hypothetical protein
MPSVTARERPQRGRFDYLVWLGGDRGYRPLCGPDSGAAAVARCGAAERAAYRLLLEVGRLRGEGVASRQAGAGTDRARSSHAAGRQDLDPYYGGAIVGTDGYANSWRFSGTPAGMLTHSDAIRG